MHRFVAHTAEVQLEIEAPSEEGVFVDAALAFAELADGVGAEPATREVRLQSADRATLLVDWLSELVFLADTDGFVGDRVVELELGQGSLRATLAGRLASPRQLVKAATCHDLVLDRRDDGWYARVVLDV